jgi:hypothetical protein
MLCPGCSRPITSDLYDPSRGFWKLTNGDWSGACPCGDWHFAVFNISNTWLALCSFLGVSGSVARVHAPSWVCQHIRTLDFGNVHSWVFVETDNEPEIAVIFEAQPPKPPTWWKRLLDDKSAV